jgi:signal transduction histidine kinase
LLLMFLNFLWVGVFFPFTLGLALFPDGRPPSPRWRWLVKVVLAILAVLCLGLLWQARPTATVALVTTQDTNGGFRSLPAGMVTFGYLATFASVLVCLCALVTRFRRSNGAERMQFRWVVWGSGLAGLLMVSAVVFDEVGDRLDIALVAGALAMAILLASFGIAITKYRLYDIDVVISKTLVYGALAVFIGVVYVGIVVGIGYSVGSGDQPNTWLGILATVIIAIVFQPLRRRFQRVANRLVYGRRATPYEVLSVFSQGISAVDPDVLQEVAQALAEGTTAKTASIWVKRAGGDQRIAAWPAGDGTTSRAETVINRVAPVAHDAEELGRVVLELEPGQPFPVTDQRLLDQVAAGLGLALRNLLLTEDLRARVEELAASRRRMVTVQNETRRRLERDLHDGAQQRLVALKIHIGFGATMAETAALDDVRSMFIDLREDADQAIETVREFARGIYPPLLESEGLGPALKSRARKVPIPVSIQAAGIGRYSKEHEATVYFCVLEALQNAIKHSGASSIVITLDDRDGRLGFEVRDDGVGFDPAAVSPNGLINIRDRMEAVGGRMDLDVEPGKGTRIHGSLPLAELVST